MSTVDATAKLQDRNWRLKNSLWLLWPILSCGTFGFVGFLICATRVKSKQWWTYAAVACSLNAIAWGCVIWWTDDKGEMTDGAGTVLVFEWLGLIGLGVLANRSYLRWKAQGVKSAWYMQGASADNIAGGSLSAPPTANVPAHGTTPFAGIRDEFLAGTDAASPASSLTNPPSVPATPSPVSASSAPLNINAVSAIDLVERLGLDQTLADRVVAARNAGGSFRDLDHLVVAAGLQPHELLRFRGKVDFGEGEPTNSATDKSAPTSGRILDF